MRLISETFGVHWGTFVSFRLGATLYRRPDLGETRAIMTRIYVAPLCIALLLPASACQKEGRSPEGEASEGHRPKGRGERRPDLCRVRGHHRRLSEREIRARTPGYVEVVHYTEGSAVKKGDLLFTIDPILAQASVTAASGSLEAAKAVLSKTDADLARVKPLSRVGRRLEDAARRCGRSAAGRHCSSARHAGFAGDRERHS